MLCSFVFFVFVTRATTTALKLTVVRNGAQVKGHAAMLLLVLLLL